MRDDELIAAHGRGEEGAFGEIVERYLPLVYGAAGRQVRDPGMAGDVAQAVFLILAKKAGRLKGGALAGWLLKATHLAARDAMKRRATRVRHEVEAGRMRTEAPVEADEIEAVTRVLDGAMAKLGEGDRTALALRYLRGQSLGEVGAGLGVSPETAGKRVQRALGRLRRVLAREGIAGRAEVIEKGLGACFVAAAPGGLKGVIVQAAAGHVQASAMSVALTKEISRMMWMSTVKVAVLVGLGAVVVGTPVTVYAVRHRATGPAEIQPRVPTVPVAAPAPAATAPVSKVIALSNGSTFELLGICADPFKSHRWWDAEGHVLENPPVDELRTVPESWKNPSIPANAREYAFAYRVNFPTEAVGLSESVWPSSGELGRDTTIIEAMKDQRRSGVAIAAYFFEPGLTQVTLAVETSCGPWRDVAHFDGHGKSSDAPGGVSMTVPTTQNGDTIAAVSFPNRSADSEYQIVAVLHDGTLSNAGLWFSTVKEATGSIRVHGTAPEGIAEFRLQSSLKAKASMAVALAPATSLSAESQQSLPAVGSSRMKEIADGTYEEAMLQRGQMIDLDTGKVSALPPLRRAGFEKAEAAVEVAGADVAYVGGPAESMVAGLGMHVLPVNASRYFDESPRKNLGKTPGFAVGTAGTMTFLNMATKEPATFEFRTREGGVGVMRLEVQGDGAVYVRCKLWRSGGGP